ncbi:MULTISPECIES: Stp1/IreP family PP2C-type Ser/Thr phosphatase [Parachlamydia]|jgi:protein phosphatase|uniref:Protein phosphatase prpC n=2 Tax=Parachlamydia acanthamoebae TaxID=83552 RepID=F8L0U4_PARAV|nr:Stp1/IreP family PP2C-type Ser/Thr phosphatase [Parachlamydia acanthamoebae]CCB86847.1 protein phosphatase prpC [Parachlamydia acanthamoebae UV-7]
MSYKVITFGLSDVGLVRQNNEDVWDQVPTIRFFVLADGMGGHQAGEVAAKETVHHLCKLAQKKFNALLKPSLKESYQTLKHAIVQVNKHIYKMSRESSDLKGMGTTLCCLYFHTEGVIYGHVGDSRIYRLRDKKLEQLTKDHSLLCEMMDLGQIHEQQMPNFLYKNIITKAIGTELIVDPSIAITDFMYGDIFMMCTDGLSDLLSQKEMENILNHASSPQEAVEKLVKAAKNKGGYDNVTVVMLHVIKENESENLSR